MDATPPVASILSVDPDPRSVPLSSVTIVFDDDAMGLRTSDFVLTRDRGQGPETLSLAGTTISPIDGQTYLLQGLTSLTEVHATYVLRLDAALEQLAELDPRQARIVEMRFFSGMTGEEIAEHPGISRNTVVRELAHSRAWLQRALESSD